MRRALLVFSVAAGILIGCVDHRAARVAATAIATGTPSFVSSATQSPTAAPTLTVTPNPTPTPSAGPPPAIVREVIEAALARDEARLRSLISWTAVPCLRPDPMWNDVVGPTPICEPSDATGTPYRVFYLSGTHQVALGESQLMAIFSPGFLGTEARVAGAALLLPADSLNHPHEKYVVEIRTVGGRGAFWVFLDERGIRRFHTYVYQPVDRFGPLFELN